MADEATTDAAGVYQLKSLSASTWYRVSVRTAATAATAGEEVVSAARLARASPAFHTVQATGTACQQKMDFIAFRRAAKFDLTGEIVGLSEEQLKHLSQPHSEQCHMHSVKAGARSDLLCVHYPRFLALCSLYLFSLLLLRSTIEIQVSLASNPSVILHKTTPLSPSIPYFEFLQLPSDSYVLNIKSSLSTRTYAFSSPALTIALTAPVHVKPVVAISLKPSAIADMQGNSLWNGLLIVSALAALLYKEKTLSLVRAAIKSIQGRNIAPLRKELQALLAGVVPNTSGSANNQAAAAASFAPNANSTAEEKKNKAKYPQKKEKTHVSTFVRYDTAPLVPGSMSPAVAPPVAASNPADSPRLVKSVSAAAAAPRYTTPVPAPRSASPVALPSPPPARVEKQARATPVPTPDPMVAVAPKAAKAIPSAAAPAAVAAVSPKTVAAAPVVAAAAPAATPVSRFCASCGNKRPDAAAKFCSNCGSKY